MWMLSLLEALLSLRFSNCKIKRKRSRKYDETVEKTEKNGHVARRLIKNETRSVSSDVINASFQDALRNDEELYKDLNFRPDCMKYIFFLF